MNAKFWQLSKHFITIWLRGVLPTNALEAHEEAWNAYPHTKTRYSSPFLDRFNIEVETKYYDDAGDQENVFELTGDELKNRIVDVMDFVNDALSPYDYVPEEDPKLYHSIKTGRGPLKEDWIEDCIKNGKPIMCAYKLCKVEFRFWGLQTRAERWIHSHALRNTMLRAHKQAWAWQDEWHGLTLGDVRELERDAAEHLSKLMARSSISASSSVYFDCVEGFPAVENSQSLIKWSSEISLIGDHERLSSFRMGQNMKVATNAASDASLLVIIFYDDIFADVSTDQNVTDPNSLRLTIEKQISADYQHLKGHIHFLHISCGQEFADTALHLISITPTYGLVHPSLALLLSSSQYYFEAVRNTLQKANEAYNQFMHSNAGRNFNGEIFAVGDYLGGILLHECLKQSRNHCHMQQSHQIVSRHSSSLSTRSHIIVKENRQESRENSWMVDGNKLQRNSSVPLTMKFRNCSRSTPNSEASSNKVWESLAFRPSMTFLLGCPLAFVLIHRKFHGYETEPLECNQLFNMYYSIDACGARLEPILNPQLAMLLPVNVPRYNDTANAVENTDGMLDSSLFWGNHRIDHILHSPHAMITLSSSALPSVLHASYWESDDVAAFILKRFLHSEGVRPINLANITKIPSEIKLGPAIANLAPCFSGNDVICVEGTEQIIHARFCYGPMDLVALSRENISAYIRPTGGDWQLVKTDITDSHGKITFELKKRLPIGTHYVKLIVHGDHSFLDLYIAVAPPGEQFVVFSIDGSLTASVSVTGRDPRVRPGVVDVVRYWYDLGYTIIYITARPDMQHKVVALWLALHNFPHGLLIFTPSFSTDPLRQKVLHLKNYLEMGLLITAAYGSSKDVSVYSSAGVNSSRIFSVTGGKRGCTNIDSYASHLKDLNEGLYDFAKPFDSSLVFPPTNSLNILSRRNLIRRTNSFTPRSGRQTFEKSRLL
ncbi:unnamed protein product [Acanthocheilonema viteae]|uniref:DDHD domain-containing protein n=1 Tax=Acanthocheilonema viteae TaxID=6277 RepID=A0A498S3L9_ACAVI|nr:unnamed protein product [Acanthocheilonema viteae]